MRADIVVVLPALSAKRIFGDKRELRDYFLVGRLAKTGGFWSDCQRKTLACTGCDQHSSTTS